MTKNRLETFTNGVLAIVLTILVLELHLPNTDHSLNALTTLAPQFFAYIFSFILISTMWVNHHYLFLKVNSITNITLWLNINLLFWSSILPATTAWVGSDINAHVPATLYAVNIVCYNISFGLLREHISRHAKLIKSRTSLEWLSLAINLLSLAITLWWPPFVFIGLISNVLLWTFPHFITHKK